MEKPNIEKVSEKIIEENNRLKEKINEKNCQIEFLETKIKELEKYATCSDENVSEMNNKIKRLEDELKRLHENRVELPNNPINVAEMLIDANYSYKNRFTGMVCMGRLYSKSELRQIAEHLLVYCNNSEDE